MRVLDGVPEALAELERAGYERIVVTNQSGVARGMFGAPTCVTCNAALARELERRGGGDRSLLFLFASGRIAIAANPRPA